MTTFIIIWMSCLTVACIIALFFVIQIRRVIKLNNKELEKALEQIHDNVIKNAVVAFQK